MKINQFIILVAYFSLPLVSMTMAAPMEKRANTPVYIEFKEIAATFRRFAFRERAQSPNYNHLAYKLNVLSTTADSALSLLNQTDPTSLQPEDFASIKESLDVFASRSTSVEQMAIKGKVWFKENEVVGKIAQILQLDAFQFYLLFKTLKQYVPDYEYTQYGKDMSTTLCGFVNAIYTIEPNTFAKNKSAYTYCVNYKAGLRGNLDTDGFDIASVATPGIETCGDSASRFLDAAYSEGTLGSIVTKCTEKNVGLYGPSLPRNALGLKE